MIEKPVEEILELLEKNRQSVYAAIFYDLEDLKHKPIDVETGRKIHQLFHATTDSGVKAEVLAATLWHCSKHKVYDLLPELYSMTKGNHSIRGLGKKWAGELTENERFEFGKVAELKKLTTFISRFCMSPEQFDELCRKGTI